MFLISSSDMRYVIEYLTCVCLDKEMNEADFATELRQHSCPPPASLGITVPHKLGAVSVVAMPVAF